MIKTSIKEKPVAKTRNNASSFSLYMMLIPGMLLTFIFRYLPLGGIVIAFQRFIPAKGLFGDQKWIGLGNFEYIFSMPNIKNVFRNTVTISVSKIVLGLLVPIIVALMLNEVSSKKFKRSIQTIIYFPYFLSWIVFAATLKDILSPSTGIVNHILQLIGMQPVYFLGSNEVFQQSMIWTDVWKNFGYGTVVYLAAITNIDPSLYEAAIIDGANRWQQTSHVTLPGMRTIIVLMCVLSMGNALNAGFDQIFNLYSPTTYETGDIIDTFVYRLGLENAKFGPAMAISVFKSFISFALISSSYWIADHFFDYRLF